jgi:hypothetical protein
LGDDSNQLRTEKLGEMATGGRRGDPAS